MRTIKRIVISEKNPSFDVKADSETLNRAKHLAIELVKEEASDKISGVQAILKDAYFLAILRQIDKEAVIRFKDKNFKAIYQFAKADIQRN